MAQAQTIPAAGKQSSAAALRWIGGFAAGFLLSGARIAGVSVPAAAYLIAALPPSFSALAVFLGAAAGSLTLWETEAAVLTLAIGLLTLTANWAARGFGFSGKPWFPPALAAGCGAVVCLLALFSRDVTGRALAALIVRILTLAAGTAVARRTLERPEGLPLCACLAALVSGSGGILLPGGIPLGGILAAGAALSLCETPLAVPMAAMGGLALDWCRPEGGSATAILTAAALAAGLPLRRRWQRLAAFLGAAGVTILLAGGRDGGLFLAAALGGGIALFLPPMLPKALPADDVRRRLELAAAAMDSAFFAAGERAPTSEKNSVSELYDRVGAKVCARCAKFSQCWRQESQKTCEILLRAAPAIQARGTALPEDFPREFSGECRHFSAFLRELDQGLDDAARRQQRLRRQREEQAVLTAQYRILASYLRRTASPQDPVTPAYLPETACRSAQRTGQTVSGDRAVCFAAGRSYCVLLCDGMGTGREAAEDSFRAADLLSRLLRAGMEPDDALELFNGLYVLRETGGAATVDLAWVDLISGSGVLYKWGGGPSYLKTSQGVKKLGTASLPPGVGVGGTQQAQQIRLSLGKGETLILTSDGVGGEEAVRLIRAAGDGSVRELAAGILACGDPACKDDRTAAVLRLRPISAP